MTEVNKLRFFSVALVFAALWGVSVGLLKSALGIDRMPIDGYFSGAVGAGGIVAFVLILNKRVRSGQHPWLSKDGG